MGIVLKKIFVVLGLAVTLLLISSCSGSGKQSTNNVDKKDSKKSLEIFSKKVEAICASVDEDVVLSASEISSGATTDPGAMAESLKTSEDEMDQFISKLEMVEPPLKFEEDWAACMDENAEIRDTFPDLSELMVEISKSNQKILDDPANQFDAMSEVEALNGDVDLIIRELELRIDEIGIVSKNMNIEDCSDTVK